METVVFLFALISGVTAYSIPLKRPVYMPQVPDKPAKIVHHQYVKAPDVDPTHGYTAEPPMVHLQRISEAEVGFTAVIDNRVKACFITEYDPEWTLDDVDKEVIMNTYTPSPWPWGPVEFDNFATRVGYDIASMCKKVNTYWLLVDDNHPLEPIKKQSRLIASTR